MPARPHHLTVFLDVHLDDYRGLSDKQLDAKLFITFRNLRRQTKRELKRAFAL